MVVSAALCVWIDREQLLWVAGTSTNPIKALRRRASGTGIIRWLPDLEPAGWCQERHQQRDGPVDAIFMAIARPIHTSATMHHCSRLTP